MQTRFLKTGISVAVALSVLVCALPLFAEEATGTPREVIQERLDERRGAVESALEERRADVASSTSSCSAFPASAMSAATWC